MAVRTTGTGGLLSEDFNPWHGWTRPANLTAGTRETRGAWDGQRYGRHRKHSGGRRPMHGPHGSRVLAGYCLWSADARIVVCDGGAPTAPQVRREESLAEGGRGLQVIDALAVQWGSFRLPGAQAVWCDFGQPLRAPEADAWTWLRCVLTAFPLVTARRSARPPGLRWPVRDELRAHRLRAACGASLPHFCFR